MAILSDDWPQSIKHYERDCCRPSMLEELSFTEKQKNLSLHSLKVTPRITKGLHRYKGITTIGEALKLTENGFLSITGFGPGSLWELKRALISLAASDTNLEHELFKAINDAGAEITLEIRKAVRDLSVLVASTTKPKTPKA